MQSYVNWDIKLLAYNFVLPSHNNLLFDNSIIWEEEVWILNVSTNYAKLCQLSYKTFGIQFRSSISQLFIIW